MTVGVVLAVGYLCGRILRVGRAEPVGDSNHWFMRSNHFYFHLSPAPTQYGKSVTSLNRVLHEPA